MIADNFVSLGGLPGPWGSVYLYRSWLPGFVVCFSCPVSIKSTLSFVKDLFSYLFLYNQSSAFIILQ